VISSDLTLAPGRSATLRRLVVLTTYAVCPPRHGPQIRTAGILGDLGDGWDVVHFSQTVQRTDLPWPVRARRCGDHWVEYRLRDPVSSAFLISLSKLGGFGPAYADRLLSLAPRRQIVRAIASADVVWVSHHYQFAWARKHTPPSTPVVVDCHAIESEVWPARRARWTRVVANEIARAERYAFAHASGVFATSEEDAATVREMGATRVVVAPNGVDVDRFRPVTADERAATRRALGLPADRVIAMFVGSAGYANRNALDALERRAAAYEAAGVDVVVVGRVGIGRTPIPGIRYVGEVDDVAVWLRAADIALAPLLDGSGTSLKSVEYLAAGLPVVATPIGVRGLGVHHGTDALVGTIDEVPAITAELARDPELRAALGLAARERAETHFSWRVIGGIVARELDHQAGG